MSKYLFLISHPAHFHMFKYAMRILKNNNHDIVAIIRPKDVLEELCMGHKTNCTQTINAKHLISISYTKQ